jgi:hypothetical protein
MHWAQTYLQGILKGVVSQHCWPCFPLASNAFHRPLCYIPNYFKYNSKSVEIFAANIKDFNFIMPLTPRSQKLRRRGVKTCDTAESKPATPWSQNMRHRGIKTCDTAESKHATPRNQNMRHRGITETSESSMTGLQSPAPAGSLAPQGKGDVNRNLVVESLVSNFEY